LLVTSVCRVDSGVSPVDGSVGVPSHFCCLPPPTDRMSTGGWHPSCRQSRTRTHKRPTG